jgi:molybdopterin-guanine dinucleotide biosynthesis protein A
MTENLDYLLVKIVIGVILAGGQSRRFGGGDKFLKKLNGKLLIDHVVDRVRSQTGDLIINSNSDAVLFKTQSLPIVPDSIQGYAGPLAGVLTGMEWVLKNKPESQWIATFPSDAPFIPLDCVKKMQLRAEKEKADIVCAASGGRKHPVCALWRVDLASDLRKAMLNEEMRKIDLWTARHRLSIVEFPNEPYDFFFNINRPGDLERAEEIAQFNAIKP